MADIGSIQLYLDGVTQSFSEWTRQFANTYYPNVGQHSYRVPAIHFNQQRLVSYGDLSALLLHPPDASKARGELAHTVVLENVEHLGHILQTQGSPLFTISALNYDNYLHRVKPPPRTKGKENRPRRKTNAKNSAEHNDSKTADPQDDASEVASSPKDVNTSRGDDAKRKGDDPTWDGEVSSRTGESQTETTNEHSDQSTHKKRHPRRKRPGQKQSKEDSCGFHDDSTESKRSPTLVAEHMPATFSERISQENVHSDKNDISDPKPSSDEIKDCSFLKTEDVMLKESSSAQCCHKEAKEAMVENLTPISAQTPPSKGKKKKQRSKKVAENSRLGTQALETVDGTNNVSAAISSRPHQQRTKTELPPRPKDMTEKGQRGDIDVVLLNQHCGVILMEVKSTGMPHPHWHYSDQEILDSVRKAEDQLERGRHVFRYIMADMSADLGITLVVALPCVSRELLDKVLKDVHLDPDVVFLCQDDLVTSNSGSSQPAPGEDKLHLHTSDVNADVPVTSQSVTSSMVSWWRSVISPHGTPLSLEHMKSIVGRVCGLMSIVTVWTRTKPRVEVRTTAQAISEAADRISDIVLLPDQADLLAQPFLTRLCLTGPMGSGKTLLLQLKGRQWLREGRRVVVLNVRTSGRGRPAGHVMEEAIRRGGRGTAVAGSVERHDLATKELDMAAFHAELEKTGPTDNLCFIMDELTHYTFPMLEELTVVFPQCRIWCVAMFVRHLPSGFHHCRLGAVLRSPPSVQLLLRELDLNPVHADVYSTRSAARGLPCDGPPVVFLQHERHDSAIRHQDCVQCADELVELLQNILGLKMPDPHCPQKSADIFSPPRLKKSPPAPKAVEAKSLSFRDILFLVCLPLGYYEMEDDGLWMAAKENVFKFCGYLHSCPFFHRLRTRGVPMKVVFDNTAREIAIPSADEIVVTDVMGVQSLERKVVIYLPGGPMLQSPGDSNTHVVDRIQPNNIAQSEQPPSSSCPVLSQSQAVESQDGCCPPSSSAQSSVPASAGLRAHCSTGQDTLPASRMNDVFTQSSQSPENKQCESSRPGGESNNCEGNDQANYPMDLQEVANIFSKEADWVKLKSVFGNMMVDDKRAKVSKAQTLCRNHPVTDPEHRAGQSDAVCRMGMDVRGDSPMLLSALEDARVARESRSPAGEGKRDYFQADSAFLVPDADAEAGHVETERQRLRQVLSSMSMDDQDWLFMAAARCLSQLIVIVPSRPRDAH